MSKYSSGVDFGQPIPRDQRDLAEKQSKKCDVALVLGSGMKVSPFCELPTKAKKMIICNLQPTPKDKKANLIIHSKIDDLIEALFIELGYSVPDYILNEKYVIDHTFDKSNDKWKIVVRGENAYEAPNLYMDKWDSR